MVEAPLSRVGANRSAVLLGGSIPHALLRRSPTQPYLGDPYPKAPSAPVHNSLYPRLPPIYRGSLGQGRRIGGSAL